MSLKDAFQKKPAAVWNQNGNLQALIAKLEKSSLGFTHTKVSDTKTSYRARLTFTSLGQELEIRVTAGGVYTFRGADTETQAANFEATSATANGAINQVYAWIAKLGASSDRDLMDELNKPAFVAKAPAPMKRNVEP